MNNKEQLDNIYDDTKLTLKEGFAELLGGKKLYSSQLRALLEQGELDYKQKYKRLIEYDDKRLIENDDKRLIENDDTKLTGKEGFAELLGGKKGYSSGLRNLLREGIFLEKYVLFLKLSGLGEKNIVYNKDFFVFLYELIQKKCISIKNVRLCLLKFCGKNEFNLEYFQKNIKSFLIYNKCDDKTKSNIEKFF